MNRKKAARRRKLAEKIRSRWVINRAVRDAVMTSELTRAIFAASPLLDGTVKQISGGRQLAGLLEIIEERS